MRILALLISSFFVPQVFGFKTNRTSCLHYVSCLEAIQSNLKECSGGAAISLTLEAKDVNIRDLVKYRALEFVGCQDRLLKEVVDFEALQILVNEDARECFEKLPESSKRIEQFTDSCDYVPPLSRNSSKGDALQCLIEFKQDREYCESLLECCPDHTRCGERMNAVSLSYQNARVKAEQIVYSMISCIVVNDPRFLREGARLQSLRDPYRNAGVPFLRPDAYTEARITRRLALTSTATLSQRRERFLKKYTQIRQVVAQNLLRQEPKTMAPVEDVVTETSSTEVPSTEATSTTTTPQPEEAEASDVHVSTIRNLIRSASDKDLSKYVSLISEGKFGELFELAEKKKAMKLDEKLPTDKFSAKMTKLKDIITEALAEKSSEKSSEMAELVEMEEKSVSEESVSAPEAKEAEQKHDKSSDLLRASRNVAEAEVQDDVKGTDEALKAEAKIDKVDKSDVIKGTDEALKTESKIDKPDVIKGTEEALKAEAKIEKIDKSDATKVDEEIKKLVKTVKNETEELRADKERALLVESEIKNSADESRSQSLDASLKSEEKPETLVGEDLPVLDKEESAESDVASTTTTTETPTLETATAAMKAELLGNSDDVLTVVETKELKEVEGSGEELEPITTTTTTPSPLESGSEVIDNVKRIRPRTEQSHCQEYASCWQTVMDYEQQCDRKYSTDVLSHGIDDSEILSILQNSSISHHEIVMKACLRPLDRSTHSTLKQLLVIQRGVRKACLDLGRNKIALTDAEEELCNTEVPSTASIDEFISNVHARSQSNHLTCRAKLEPIREACSIARNCCASVDTCDNYISSSPVKKLETEAIRRLVKRQNDCETKMLQTLTYIHEQLSNPSRRRRFYYH